MAAVPLVPASVCVNKVELQSMRVRALSGPFACNAQALLGDRVSVCACHARTLQAGLAAQTVPCPLSVSQTSSFHKLFRCRVRKFCVAQGTALRVQDQVT